MRKILPYSTKPRTKIVPVGNDEIGVVHLQQLNAITPNENTTDFQEDTRKAIRMQKILASVTDKMAKELGITKKEARERLFSMPVKSANPDTDNEAKPAEPDEDDQMGIYNWMTPEQVDEFLQGRANEEEIAIKAATLLIQNRIAYPVTVIANAKEKATEIYVETGLEEFEPGCRIRFGNIQVTVDGYPGGDTLEVSPLSSKLAAGSVGYLLDDRGRELLGAPDWTVEDTRNLPAPLIGEIYRFYQVEAGIIGDVAESEDVGESMTKPLTESLPSAQSNGAKSIGDCNILAVETNV